MFSLNYSAARAGGAARSLLDQHRRSTGEKGTAAQPSEPSDVWNAKYIFRSVLHRLGDFWVIPAIVAAVVALLFIQWLRDYLHGRRVRQGDRAITEREREQRKGHRRERPDHASDEDSSKRRRYEQDPWLKRLGYFRREKPPA